jgi:small multidrug resistance pump
MTGWLFLLAAIVTELAGTLALRTAAVGRRWFIVAVVLAYATSFTLLGLTLRTGLGLGLVYGIWCAAGVALAAILSRFLFKEALTALMGAGILLIAGGVLLIHVGA